ncbi:helix-turn-helix domain-containing protein [Variovorax sp. LjRoot290]|uniref:helix-turn-helix domain-containing protein n=1 Tax=Variovorax sp. LjRoot290 TaxID=3342316 RepID=UPI003ECF236D
MAKNEVGLGLDLQGTPRGGDSTADEQLAWQRFVLIHGSGALNRDLAQVLGRTVAEIEGVKQALGGTGGRAARGGKNGFEELFELWHGRPPTDAEWRAPAFYGRRRSYEWLPPEVAMLATLVGQMGPVDIAGILTTRLRQITGDPTATRDRMAVQNQVARMGLTFSDVLGGISVAEAGREVGSYNLVHQAVRNGLLKARQVGRHLVIPHKAWTEWKEKISAPPEGYVQLSTLKGPLNIASDKLSEFSRMGYVPRAVQVKPYGTKNLRTTQFGSWYVPEEVAEQLLADRRAGRPMPWHGKPLLDNLKVTFRLWQKRQHPKGCAACAQIWGQDGPPRNFEDYVARYPALDHGAKRHLTMVWNPGLTIAEAAQQAGRTEQSVRRSIANGMLATTKVGRTTYITRTDATRWIARKCPTGDNEKSWVSIETAMKQYLFTQAELDDFVDRGVLKNKIGTDGAMRGILYVSRHQCAQLREKLGFSEEQAAARARLTVPQLRALLKGVNWRGAKGIPLATLQAVIKRSQSRQGLTVEEAAEALGSTAECITACIADGTITVKRNKWDERLYLTPPSLERLREVQFQPTKRVRLGDDWARLSAAAALAGVSTTTLIRWGEAGDVRRVSEASGWHYHLDDVRARARLYWQTVRFKRARAPAWLRTERQATCSSEPVAAAASTPGRQPATAAAIAKDGDVAPTSTLPSTPISEALIAWIGATKIYLSPLKALRAQRTALDGLPSEKPSAVRNALTRQYARLSDLDLVSFADLDSADCSEAIQQALSFVGVADRHLDTGQRDRVLVAIRARLNQAEAGSHRIGARRQPPTSAPLKMPAFAR